MNSLYKNILIHNPTTKEIYDKVKFIRKSFYKQYFHNTENECPINKTETQERKEKEPEME